MKRILLLSLTYFTILCSPVSYAFDTVKVAEGVYALVGDLGQRSKINFGHNMTSGFIETNKSIVVIDAGASIAGAKAIHQAIKKVSKKPIKWVINTGGQDHRWIGNAYFQTLGATIIASESGKQDMIARTNSQFSMIKKYMGDTFEETAPTYPNNTFKDNYTLPVTGKTIKLVFTGGGHTPGDIFVVLPDQALVFTGDIVFSQRLLGIQKDSALRWIKSLEYLRDHFKSYKIIPGHGAVTDIATSLKDSYNYLTLLRDKVKSNIDEGAFDAVESIEGIDQSAFSYLENYSSLSFRSRNALHVAEELFDQ